MKKKKRSRILSNGLHDEKSLEEVVNSFNNDHTIEQAETNCLTKPAHMDNFTCSDDVSSRDHMESSKKKVRCFNKSKSDPPRTTEVAYPAVCTQNEEPLKHRSCVQHQKINQQSYDSKTYSLKTEAYSNVVPCSQEQEQTHTVSSITHHEDRNICTNCQRTDQSSGVKRRKKHRKRTGNYLATEHGSSNGDSELNHLAQTGVITLSKTIFQRPRKLLILDLNGILVDIQCIPNADQIYAERDHVNVSWKTAFKRPYCHDFLDFCFSVFDIGIWSSRMKHNVEVLVDYLMGKRKEKLLFCWDNSKCTHTGFSTIENRRKPLILKELTKLWDKEDPDLPWEKGTYSPSNTLLIDDSPCKALCNPPFTGMFPRPYSFRDEQDNSLGRGGDIRVFLKGLAKADNVQEYVEKKRIGQCSITDRDPSWKFYLQVIERVEKNKRNA